MSIDLNLKQRMILRGKICPYCGNASDYIDSKDYYSNGVSYGNIYICRPCDAIVGVHDGTDKALGRLAKPSLRAKKKEAHLHFDKLWKFKYYKRKDAYTALAQFLNLPKEFTHIGFFSEKTCEKVIQWSKEELVRKEEEGKTKK